MRTYLYKGKKLEEGYNHIVSSKNTDLKLLEFGRIFLPKRGGTYSEETGNNEAVLSLLKGTFSIEIKESTSKKIVYQDIGGRSDVFSDKPTMIYLPKDATYTITAKSPELDIGISMAPSKLKCPSALVKPEDVEEKWVGSWNWRRKVYSSIVENVKADKLLVGETFNPPGNWSSSPPHKHDNKAPGEVVLEEVYFFQVKPVQGFGIQRVYTAPDIDNALDEVYVVEDGDTVVIPKGYHPVVAAPGYQLYYLWVLAGEEREFGAWSDDPKHAWLRNCEPILNDVLKRA